MVCVSLNNIYPSFMLTSHCLFSQVPCNSADVLVSVENNIKSYSPLQEVGNLEKSRSTNEKSGSEIEGNYMFCL